MDKVYTLGEFTLEFAAGGKALLGDINGDGMMEAVFVKGDTGRDFRYVPHQVVSAAAYRLDGSILWTCGDDSAPAGEFDADFPAQIADIDGDGKLEFVCVMQNALHVFDGATGTIKCRAALPSPEAHDCLIICNLTGRTFRGDLVLKDRYEHLWACSLESDGTLKTLWTHTGNVGHFPLAVDINGDGFDEVMAGYDLLDHTGRILWSCKNLDEHADCLWAGDVFGDGKLELCVGGSDTCLYDACGNELWRYTGSVESQHVALGHYIPGKAGMLISGLDRIERGDGYVGSRHSGDHTPGGRDGIFFLAADGTELWKENRTTPGWLTIVETFCNWNGRQQDYILAYRRGGGLMPGLYDADCKRIAEFPTEGYVVHGDLFGRGMDDVIVYTGTKAVVYGAAPYDIPERIKMIETASSSEKPTPLVQPRRLTMSTLYPGCIAE